MPKIFKCQLCQSFNTDVHVIEVRGRDEQGERHEFSVSGTDIHAVGDVARGFADLLRLRGQSKTHSILNQ